MAKYKLTFYGKRKPAMHAAFPSLVERVVEIPDGFGPEAEEVAAMQAYETHEHITGGVMGVKVELCQPNAEES